MKFLFGVLIGLVLAVGIAGAAMKVAWGDLTDLEFGEEGGAKLSKSYDLRDFDRIEIAGVFDLDVAVGGDYSVAISGSQRALERAAISAENGVLSLDFADGGGKREHRIARDGLTARVSLPALKGIEASGVVDGDVDGISADSFSADVSGVGEMTLSGRCLSLTASVSGVGALDAENLHCENVNVDVSGVGKADVYASRAVSASIGGVGRINVSGSPSEVAKEAGSPFARISVN